MPFRESLSRMKRVRCGGGPLRGHNTHDKLSRVELSPVERSETSYRAGFIGSVLNLAFAGEHQLWFLAFLFSMWAPSEGTTLPTH